MPGTPVRIVYFSTWAEGLEDAAVYLESIRRRDLRSRVRDPADPELMGMARLDADWDAECLRCFAAMAHPEIEFRPAMVADPRGLVQFLERGNAAGETPWLVLINQRPAPFASVIGKLLALFTSRGGRVFYWAYDDASRNMACFRDEVAPHLSVLVHDEEPLAPEVADALPSTCRTLRRSWVANIVPFQYPFREDVEPTLVFLGSKLGVTEHRRAQLRALERRFGEAFVSITDHSVPVADRGRFGGIQVHVCPEGRKFDVPTLGHSHTDRPFWAGCMGQVPVSEDSRGGGRLDELADARLILRYPHGDTDALIRACERALEVDVDARRHIYGHFNREETVGPVAAGEIAGFSRDHA